MTLPGAHLLICLGFDPRGQSEVLFLGNRSGLLSLANVILWLWAESWRRELLSLSELPFVKTQDKIAIHIRVGTKKATGGHGFLRELDRGDTFEWVIPEDDLQAVGLSIHRLAAKPEHEYERLNLDTTSAAGIHVRMTDAREWL